MVVPRLLQRLDQAIARAELPLDRECLKAERVVAMARLGNLVEARIALAHLKAQAKRQTEPRLLGWLSFAEAIVVNRTDHTLAVIPHLCREAKQRAITAGDQALQFQASVALAGFDFHDARWEALADELMFALTIFPADEAPELARFDQLLGRAYSYAGKSDVASGYYKRAHRLAAGEGDTAMIGGIMADRTMYQTDALALEDAFGRGNPEAARRVKLEIDSFTNFNSGIGKADRQSWNSMFKSMLCVCLGQFEEASALLETHMRNAMAEGLGEHSAYFHAPRAWCLWHLDEKEAARRDMQIAKSTMHLMPDFDDIATTQARMARLLDLMGHSNEAALHRAEADLALARYRHSQEALCVQLSRVERERERSLKRG
ncbi:MAG: hypothetical protein C4K60_02060 [Ideonella sp. MAG2]|nr:MAG: hypothetical protein C4K60_02060 [Ideonella sp. MAG2]